MVYQEIELNTYDDILESLNMCGCGMTSHAAIALRNTLNHVNKLKNVHDDESEYKFKDWEADGVKLFGNDGVETLIYYMLDEKELTEHGGSVPGWLTQKGERYLEALNTISEDD